MNRQSVGVLLCALLASTFGHELLSRLHATHSERVAHSQRRSHLQDRTGTDSKKCKTKCVTTGIYPEGNLTVVFNATTHIAGLVNSSARLVFIKDIKARLVGIFSFKLNIAIIVNLNVSAGRFLRRVLPKDELKEEGAVFINKQVTLTGYWEQSGPVYDHNNGTKEAKEFVREVLIELSGGGLAVAAQDACSLLLYMSGRMSECFKVVGPLLTSATFEASTTYQLILARFEGLKKIVQQIGGTKKLDEKGIKLDTKRVVIESSVEFAAYLLVELEEKKIDLKEVLDCDTTILLWIASLSANSTVCVSGVIKVVANVVGFINGKVTIDELISVLIDYFVLNTGREGSKENLDAAISASLSVIKTAGLQTKLKVVVDILIKIKENTLIVANVNVSKIIQILFRQDLPIRLIIQIFDLLKAKIKLEIAVAKLIVIVIGLLVGGGEVGVEVIFGIPCGDTLTISVIVRALLLARGDVSKALNSISITIQILEIINVSLQAHGTSIEIILSSKIVITLILDSVRNLDKHPPGPPKYTHTDVGGAANGNPNNTVSIGSIGGNTVDQHNSGGNSSAHVNGGPNVIIDQTGNKGGDVNHINENEKKDEDGNKGGETNIFHVGGLANGNSINGVNIGNIGGNQVNQNDNGGNSNADVGGGSNVAIDQTGNKGGAVNHINGTQKRGHDKHGYGG